MNGFAIADMPLGNITTLHAEVTRSGEAQILALEDVKAQKNKSLYEMAQGKVEFGGEASMKMDAMVKAIGFNLRDLLDVFHLNEDPRFEGIDGNLSGDTTMHVVLGGHEDECGGGFISLHSSPHLSAVDLFGEKFDDGDADLDLRWRDRAAGFAGADLDVHAFTLHKVRREKDGAAFGSLLGSATVRQGGVLHGNVVLEGLPLSRLQTLGSLAPELEGTVSGLAQVGGTVDAFTVDADVDVSPVHIRSGDLGASKLHVTMTQLPPKGGDHRQDALRRPAARALRQRGVHQGHLVARVVRRLGRSVRRTSPPRSRHGVAGEADGSLRGAFAPEGRARHAREGRGDDGRIAREARGRDQRRCHHRPHQTRRSRVGVCVVHPAFAVDRRRGQEARPQTDGVADRPREQQGRNSGVRARPVRFERRERSHHRSRRRARSIRRPDARRARRSRTGRSLRARGHRSQARQGLGDAVRSASRHGTSGGSPGRRRREGARDRDLRPGSAVPVNDVEVDVHADASEVRITHGQAKFAGGTLALGGRVPIRNLGLGNVELTLGVRNVHFAPAEGISAGLDADLGAEHRRCGRRQAQAPSPHRRDRHHVARLHAPDQPRWRPRITRLCQAHRHRDVRSDARLRDVGSARASAVASAHQEQPRPDADPGRQRPHRVGDEPALRPPRGDARGDGRPFAAAVRDERVRHPTGRASASTTRRASPHTSTCLATTEYRRTSSQSIERVELVEHAARPGASRSTPRATPTTSRSISRASRRSRRRTSSSS